MTQITIEVPVRNMEFRAWDKTKNEWVQSFVVFKTGSVTVKGGKPKKFEAGNKRFIIQQFTGFKDHKGRKIFEGDILNYGGVACPVIYNMENLSAGFQIIRKSNSTPDRVAMPLGIPFSGGIEVIGNVLENPELIDAKIKLKGARA